MRTVDEDEARKDTAKGLVLWPSVRSVGLRCRSSGSIILNFAP